MEHPNCNEFMEGGGKQNIRGSVLEGSSQGRFPFTPQIDLYVSENSCLNLFSL